MTQFLRYIFFVFIKQINNIVMCSNCKYKYCHRPMLLFPINHHMGDKECDLFEFPTLAVVPLNLTEEVELGTEPTVLVPV